VLVEEEGSFVVSEELYSSCGAVFRGDCLKK